MAEPIVEPVVPENVEEVVEVPEPTIPGTIEEPEVPVAPEVPDEVPEVPIKEPAAPVAEEPPVVPPVDEKPPSRRENLRIQTLLERIKKQDEPTPARPTSPFDFKTQLDAEPEVIARI